MSGEHIASEYATQDNSGKVIYDVGGGTGEWSRWYRLAGYDVRIIDPRIWPHLRASDWKRSWPRAHGVLMAIPCKEFVRAGARWWPEKDRDRPELLRDAMAVAREILDFRDKARPEWWALENPPGRLPRLFPELNEVPRYQFNPFDFGDPWGKPTMIWGTANRPAVRKKVKMTQAQKVRIHHVPPGPYRGWLRAITPPGFAKAFFEVNP